MARFFEANAAGVCVALTLSVNQSAVSLGWFWAMARSYPMTRSATTSCPPSSWGIWTRGVRIDPVWSGPRDRSRSELGLVFALNVRAVPRVSLLIVVPIWLRTARGLRWPCTYGGRACVFVRVCAVLVCTVLVRGLGINGRVCSFVRASAVRMCTVPVLGLGLSAYSLPGGVYGQNFYWACALHFSRVHVRYGVRLGQCEQCIMYVCVCSCMAVGACSSSVVPLAVSTCMRALYSIWHGGLGGVRSIQGCYLHVSTERAPLEQCLAWLARAMYLSCLYLYRAYTPCTCQHG